MPETVQSHKRRFARVRLRIRTRFRILTAEIAEDLREKLMDTPSVWAPENETVLIDLASTGSSNEAMLARAVLGLARQVGRLSHSVFDSTGPNAVGTLHQLSGGGGLLSSSAALQPGEQLDLRMWDEDPQVPPIRMLAEIVRVDHPTPGPFPLRFTAIHPQDRERLIRYLYEVQRRALREARTAAD